MFSILIKILRSFNLEIAFTNSKIFATTFALANY